MEDRDTATKRTPSHSPSRLRVGLRVRLLRVRRALVRGLSAGLFRHWLDFERWTARQGPHTRAAIMMLILVVPGGLAILVLWIFRSMR